jgi:hypothetical protein
MRMLVRRNFNNSWDLFGPRGLPVGVHDQWASVAAADLSDRRSASSFCYA